MNEHVSEEDTPISSFVQLYGMGVNGDQYLNEERRCRSRHG